MKIDLTRNGSILTVAVTGRLDTMTSPELEKVLDRELDDTERLVFDFGKLEYISSAGLRVLLGAVKQMDIQGEMKLINVRKSVMEVFEITGFIDMLDVENTLAE